MSPLLWATSLHQKIIISLQKQPNWQKNRPTDHLDYGCKFYNIGFKGSYYNFFILQNRVDWNTREFVTVSHFQPGKAVAYPRVETGGSTRVRSILAPKY